MPEEQEQQKQDISIGVEGNVEGELNVAGRDVISTRYETKNIIQRLPLPVVIGGLAAMAIGLIIAAVVIINQQRASTEEAASGVSEDIGEVAESIGEGQVAVAEELGDVGEGVDQVAESVATLAGPTPTPLPPFEAAAEGEILIIVTDFTGGAGEAAATRIFRALSARIDEDVMENVRVERLEDEAPEIASEAAKLGAEFGATMVVWGTADEFAFEPFYEIVANEEVIQDLERPDLLTVIADAPSFNAYVVEGAPNEFEYIMLVTLGQINFASGNLEMAIDLFEEAQRSNLGDRSNILVWADFYLGVTHYYGTGDLEAASSAFTQAIERVSDFPFAYINQGVIVYLLNNDVDGAEQYFTTAIDLMEATLNNPEYTTTEQQQRDLAQTYANRTYMYTLQDNLDAALADAQRAVELDPENPLAVNNLGNVYETRGEYETASEYYQQAVDIDPTFTLGLYSLAHIHNQLNNLDEAIAAYEQYFVVATESDDYYEAAAAEYQELTGDPPPGTDASGEEGG